ncbi:MAG: prevent-host-death family protein [Gemmatimonadetes bacterium]|nr:prevent-host-death family protein [Gemmatimonadota bacterium]
MVHMTSVGIRELKNNLSRFVRRVEAGESFDVTDRGRTVARLVPIFQYGDRTMNRLDKLIAEGSVMPAANERRAAIKWPKAPLVAPGVAAALIDEDRGD